MQARMKNPAMVHPDAMSALGALAQVMEKGPLPDTTRDLVHLRVSQINGCGVCVDLHAHGLRKTKEPLERLLAIGAWRDVPYFTPPERAALALAESITRIADTSDPVPDGIWDEASKHYDEAGLAQLVLLASLANFWNRLNVPTRQVAGAQRW